MSKLFISHASEDKKAFVRPLAGALIAAGFDVWYDEYELTLGDSLRAKIDHGLSTCDYGIAVLSHSFFSKKWPQLELDGLFSLEVNSRKVILPLWHGVTKEDVDKFSPILGGRLGGRTDRGIDNIVEDIRRATNVSARSRELEAIGEGRAALGAAIARLTAQHDELRRMKSRDAREKLMRAGRQVKEAVIASVQELNKSEGKEHFKVVPSMGSAIYVEGPLELFVSVDPPDGQHYTGESSELTVRYCKTNRDDYGTRTHPTTHKEIDFKPRMVTDDSVHWDEVEGDLMTADQLGERILRKFAEYIDGKHR